MTKCDLHTKSEYIRNFKNRLIIHKVSFHSCLSLYNTYILYLNYSLTSGGFVSEASCFGKILKLQDILHKQCVFNFILKVYKVPRRYKPSVLNFTQATVRLLTCILHADVAKSWIFCQRLFWDEDVLNFLHINEDGYVEAKLEGISVTKHFFEGNCAIWFCTNYKLLFCLVKSALAWQFRATAL